MLKFLQYVTKLSYFEHEINFCEISVATICSPPQKKKKKNSWHLLQVLTMQSGQPGTEQSNAMYSSKVPSLLQ